MPSLSLPGEALCVSWSRTGRRIVVGYADGDAYIRKIDDKSQSIVLPGDRGATGSVSWSPGGNCIATGGNRGTVRLWDAGHGTRISEFALDDAVTGLAMSDAALAVATRHGRLHFLLTEPQFSRTHPFESRSESLPADDLLRSTPPAVLTAITWSHDTKLLAIAADSDVVLWNFRRQCADGLLPGDRASGPIGSVSFSADDRFLAVKSSHEGVVRIWHVPTRTLLNEFEERGDPRLLEGHPTSGLAFHPSLPMLATLDHRDRWVRVWDYEESAVMTTAAS
jgi:WD40 repeat protein